MINQIDMKVIFLDFDGVLNSENWYIRRRDTDSMDDFVSHYPFYEFDPLTIERLNRIVEESCAKVVVSSTWRLGKLPTQLQDMLNVVGFKGDIIDNTPRLYAKGFMEDDSPITYNTPRGCEIDWWLKNVGKYQRINWSIEKQLEYLKAGIVTNYVILDDDSDMLYSQREHFICTSGKYGLTDEMADRAIKILNTPITELYYEI
jgi:hypothetical protein